MVLGTVMSDAEDGAGHTVMGGAEDGAGHTVSTWKIIIILGESLSYDLGLWAICLGWSCHCIEHIVL